MSTEEKKIYDILFPDDDNLYRINYAYYTAGTNRALSTLKSKIRDNYTTLNIVEDKKQHGSFFITVFQKDVDTFLI